MTWEDIKGALEFAGLIAVVALLALIERMRKTFATREQHSADISTLQKDHEALKQSQFHTNTISQTAIGKADAVVQMLIDNQRQRDQLHEHMGKLNGQVGGVRDEMGDMRERLARLEERLEFRRDRGAGD